MTERRAKLIVWREQRATLPTSCSKRKRSDDDERRRIRRVRDTSDATFDHAYNSVGQEQAGLMSA